MGSSLLPKKTEGPATGQVEIVLSELYRRTLRKMHWRPIPVSVLATCYSIMQNVGAVPKSGLLEEVFARCDSAVTTAEVRKAAGLLLKAGLLIRSGINEGGDAVWQVSAVPEPEMLDAVDQAMVVRLTAGLNGTSGPLQRKHLAPLLHRSQSPSEIDQWIREGQRRARMANGQNGA